MSARLMLLDDSATLLNLLTYFRESTLEARAKEFISKTNLEKDLVPAIRRLATASARTPSN
jgi:hypothetical protein